ncbi:MAG TPA: PqqD family protein, partial [Polyangiaceae bacterium LLY-WYZ-15_(1-7)]|nr:PqqD family protein [Polyangiaceae bacterium LLY-WYZ-15_(1-7)]
GHRGRPRAHAARGAARAPGVGVSLAGSARVRHAERIAARVIEGKAVVIVIDDQKVHSLNEVGSFIWEQAEEVRTVDEIVDAIVSEFEVEREVAEADAAAFIEQLRGLGALEIESQAG